MVIDININKNNTNRQVDTVAVIEKLKDVISTEIGNKKVFDKDVAISLGLSKESLAQHKKNNTIPYREISYFCANKKISINWVLFEQLPKELEEQTVKYTKIKYYANVNASAGGGAVNFEEDYELIAVDSVFLNSLVKSNNIASKHIIAINVIGDSMSPTLNDRDIILCDTTKFEINKGGVFVVLGSGGLFVKRVSLMIDGKIELISDNKNYTSQIMDYSDLEQFKIFGKVIGKVGEV